MQNSINVSSQSWMMPCHGNDWYQIWVYACNVPGHAPNEMQPLTAHQNCKNSREVNLFLGKYLAHPPQLFTFFPSRVMLMHDKRRVVRRETGRIIKIAERDFCVLAFTYLFVVYFSFSVYSVFLIFSGKNHGHSYLSVSFQHLHNSSIPNWHQIYMYVTSLRLEQILH